MRKVNLNLYLGCGTSAFQFQNENIMRNNMDVCSLFMCICGNCGNFNYFGNAKWNDGYHHRHILDDLFRWNAAAARTQRDKEDAGEKKLINYKANLNKYVQHCDLPMTWQFA